MSREQIDTLVAQYLADKMRELEEQIAETTWHGRAGRHARECLEGFAVADLGDLKDLLAHNRLKSVMPVARKLMPDATDLELRMLARRLLEADYERAQTHLRVLQGEPLPRPAPAQVAPPAAPEVPSRLLSQMIEDYVSFKSSGGKWTHKTRSQLTNLFRVQLELIGDRPVDQVTKEDMRGLYRMLPQLPTHAPKRYRGMTAEEAIAAADAQENDARLSPKSQNDYFTHIKSLWKWAAENDYVVKSPAVVRKRPSEYWVV